MEKAVIIVEMDKDKKEKFQALCKMQDRTMGSKIRELVTKWMGR